MLSDWPSLTDLTLHASKWPILGMVPGPDGRWQPGIGDPSALGWTTVLAYFMAAVLVVLAYRRTPQGARALELFWALLAVLLIALGINKQLDLQSLGTEVAREIARSQGWYSERRHVQAAFIFGLAVCGVMGFLLLVAATWRHLRITWLPILGVCVLVVFVFARASSFHHMEQLIGQTLSGATVNQILELSGIALVALGAGRVVAAGFARRARMRKRGGRRYR